MVNNLTVKSNLIQIGLICSSSKCLLPPSPSQAQLVNLYFSKPKPRSAWKLKLFQALAEPGSDFYLVSKPSQASTAWAFWLKPAQARASLAHFEAFSITKKDNIKNLTLLVLLSWPCVFPSAATVLYWVHMDPYCFIYWAIRENIAQAQLPA